MNDTAGMTHDDETCPWCGQPISHDRFVEIEARIAEKERQHFAELERQLIDKNRQELARRRADIEREAREQVQSELQEGLKKAEAAIHKAEETADKARADADARIEKILAQQTRMLEERSKLLEEAETRRIEAVNAEKNRAYAERLRLEEKLQSLSRQLQNKTAGELGEGGEIDLFEILRETFPHDRITRVTKGTAGADILHEVIEDGRYCGRLIYEAKNRNAWRSSYVDKLKADQLEAGAEHAILCTNVFPAGSRQIHQEKGVLIAAPPRVAALSDILRKHLVQTHHLRLSNQARFEKSDALYAFITSDRCGELFEQIARKAEDLEELDQKERRDHENRWKRRGEMIHGLRRAHHDLAGQIDRILLSPDQDDA
jgi:hypothetical protein